MGKKLNQLKKLINDNKLLFDIINVILGIGVIILVILAFLFKNNPIILFVFFMVCGIMNIVNGLKFYKESKKRTMANSFVMLGVIIIIVGVYVFKKSI